MITFELGICLIYAAVGIEVKVSFCEAKESK
jgi:hypothetical protein